jgi:hypothetical protein
MKRSIFLTLASSIALTVGAFALTFPALLLESKGVMPSAATKLWMQETGLLLMSVGGFNALLRNQTDNSIVKVLLLVNLLVQAGLFAIEAIGYASATITKLSGIMPNLTLHVLLAIGFVYYLIKMPQQK